MNTLLQNDKEVIKDSISSDLKEAVQNESPSTIIEDQESKAPKGDSKSKNGDANLTKTGKKSTDSKKESNKEKVTEQSDTDVPKVVKVNPMEALPEPATQVGDPKKLDSVPAVQKSEEISKIQKVTSDTLPMPEVKKEPEVTQQTDTTNKKTE